jgi:hypothetical protein
MTSAVRLLIVSCLVAALLDPLLSSAHSMAADPAPAPLQLGDARPAFEAAPLSISSSGGGDSDHPLSLSATLHDSLPRGPDTPIYLPTDSGSPLATVTGTNLLAAVSPITSASTSEAATPASSSSTSEDVRILRVEPVREGDFRPRALRLVGAEPARVGRAISKLRPADDNVFFDSRGAFESQCAWWM